MIRRLLAAVLTALLLCGCASEGSGFDVTETIPPDQIRAMLESAEESLRASAEPEPTPESAETTLPPETTAQTETTAWPETTAPVTADEPVSEVDPDTVYWSPSGGVWHIDAACSSLKQAKAVISGSISDAMAAGKARVCKTCGE